MNLLRWMLVVALVAGTCCAQNANPERDPISAAPDGPHFVPATPSLPTIYVVGDSSAARNGSTHEDKPEAQQGWAVYLEQYFDLSRVNVVDAALSGRSSRNYLTQGWWNKIVEQLKPGDVVLIQFGHNDWGPIDDAKRARGSLPGDGDETREIENAVTHQHEVVHTFGWYLRRYVKDTKAKGATAIVLSTTALDQWTNGTLQPAAPGALDWASKAAKQSGALYLDVNSYMARLLQQMGQAAATALYEDNDRVHVKVAGAHFQARCTAEALLAMPNSPVAQYRRTDQGEMSAKP